MPTLEEQLTAAIKAQNDLTQAVALYKSQLDSTVAAQKAEYDRMLAAQKTAYDAWRAGSALNHAVIRTSRNQLGAVTGDLLDGFQINGAYTQKFSVVKTVRSGIAWADRDATDKEWLTAMGLEGVQYFIADFNIVKLAWSGARNGQWTFFQQNLTSSCQTSACYAKKIQGDFRNPGYFSGITDRVKLCGYSTGRAPIAYSHPHPEVATDSGEVHFALLGTVMGDIPLDNPRNWGYFMSLWATSSNDLT